MEPDELQRTAVSPAKPNGVVASVLSIIPGAGHWYLGQRGKAALMFATAPVSVFVAWHDARVMARRINERGTVGDWEFFWNSSTWRLVEVTGLKTTEVIIAEEKRVIDNTESDSGIRREFKIQRKWSASCEVEEEQIRTTVETAETTSLRGRILDLPIIDGFKVTGRRKTKTLENTLRERVAHTTHEEHVHEELVVLSVPARVRMTVTFRWKHQESCGSFVLEDQFKNRISAPFKVVTGLTFDQSQVDQA